MMRAVLFLVLCCTFQLSVGQGFGVSSVGSIASTIKPLTKGVGPFFVQTTFDEQTVCFLSNQQGRGNQLFSVSRSDANDVNSAPPPRLLSQANGAFQQDVATYRLSGGQGFVQFEGTLVSTSVYDYFVSPINGRGNIVSLAPAIPTPLAGTFGSLTVDRPCGCVGKFDTQIAMLLPTASANGGTSAASELWVNNAFGGNLRRLSVDLSQSFATSVNKFIRTATYYTDYILYSANPGINGATDPYHVYGVSWDAAKKEETFTMSTKSPVTGTSWPTQFVRSGRTSYTGGTVTLGRYVAFLQNAVVANQASVYVYDLSTKTLLNSGNPVNPAIDATSLAGGCNNLFWTPGDLKLFFRCAVLASPRVTRNLYMWDPVTGGAAVQVSDSNLIQDGSASGVLAVSGDYVVYTIPALTAAPTLPVLYSYNYRTAGPNNVLNPTLLAGGTFNAILGGRGTVSTSWDSSYQLGNKAFVLFNAQATAIGQVDLYSTPIAGGTPLRLNIPLNAGVSGTSTATNLGCGVPPATPNCNLPSTCSCATDPAFVCNQWLLITQPNVDGNGTLLVANSYDGTTPTALNNAAANNLFNVNVVHFIASPTVGSSSEPLVIYSASALGGTKNLFVNRFDATVATAKLLSTGVATPLTPSTGVTGAKLSNNRQWIAYQSPTATLSTSTFYQKVDGSTAPIRVELVAPTANVFAAAFDFSADSAHLVAFSTDSTTSLTRTAMLVAQVANSKTIDLTPQFNTSGVVLSGDPMRCLASGVSCTACGGVGCSMFQAAANIDCRGSAIYYSTNLLTATGASTNAFYSVPLTGGSTSRLSWDPSVGVSASALQLQRATGTVSFSGNLYAAAVTDFFVNSAISSLVTVALLTWATLLIAVAL